MHDDGNVAGSHSALPLALKGNERVSSSAARTRGAVEFQEKSMKCKKRSSFVWMAGTVILVTSIVFVLRTQTYLSRSFSSLSIPLETEKDREETHFTNNATSRISASIRTSSSNHLKESTQQFNRTFATSASKISGPKENEMSSSLPSSPAFSDQQPSVATAAAAVRPIFKCNDPHAFGGRNTTKLIFVHIFKTAGSTLRQFFSDYSLQCHAGWALLTRCAPTTAQSIRSGGYWMRAKNEPCVLKKLFAWKSNEPLFLSNNRREQNFFFTNQILKRHVDILGGHLPLGSGFAWTHPQNNQPVNVRYVAFFRDAIHKYVSSVLYSNRKLKSVNDCVRKIKRDVTKLIVTNTNTTTASNGSSRKNQYYEKYHVYLITPLQREEIKMKKKHLTVQERTQLVMSNLVAHNVVIGIVERMSESMELLNHLMNSDGTATRIFHKYGMRKKMNIDTDDHDVGASPEKQGSGTTGSTSATSSGVVANKSKLSTSAVVEELRKDAEFFAKLQEYVKYEQMITDYAFQLHLNQYQVVQKEYVS